MVVSSRPSDARRAYLREAHLLNKPLQDRNNIVLSNFCPIERYYSTAEKVLNAFVFSLESQDLDRAYVLGKRFTSFSTETLPTHSYYNSSKRDLRKLRNENIRNVQAVVEALEDIAKMMDEEEINKAKLEEKRREEAARKEILRQRKKKEEELQLAQHLKEQKALSLEEKLQRWDREYPKERQQSNSKVTGVQDISTLESSESFSLYPSVESVKQNIVSPPSYEQAASISSSITSLFLPPPIEVPSYNEPEPTKPLYPSVSDLPTIASLPAPTPVNEVSPTIDASVSLSSQRIEVEETYLSLKHSNHIQSFSLNTHQGRLPSSTNGCAVIAPLIAIHHLSLSVNESPTLPDAIIENVIDNEAPPILSSVRDKLGLPPEALIIPSDVHDYLLEDLHKITQEQFIGVSGGNILNSNHLQSFFSLFQSDSFTKKSAATFYFHEHVICVLKIIHFNSSTIWYDVIDSLPNPEQAVRIRCKSLSALEITIKQYAFKKFGDKDWDYINSNSLWNDEMCDFDPRVFQAFVWTQL